jgi:hypothetical protein
MRIRLKLKQGLRNKFEEPKKAGSYIQKNLRKEYL